MLPHDIHFIHNSSSCPYQLDSVTPRSGTSRFN
uniref:Uncharacterized protein n=1 Tax=Arundo donax TaxID=35708 RepID=A0A0A9BC81_ARUDO